MIDIDILGTGPTGNPITIMQREAFNDLHVMKLKLKFGPMVIGCVIRTAGSSPLKIKTRIMRGKNIFTMHLNVH